MPWDKKAGKRCCKWIRTEWTQWPWLSPCEKTFFFYWSFTKGTTKKFPIKTKNVCTVEFHRPPKRKFKIRFNKILDILVWSKHTYVYDCCVADYWTPLSNVLVNISLFFKRAYSYIIIKYIPTHFICTRRLKNKLILFSHTLSMITCHIFMRRPVRVPVLSHTFFRYRIYFFSVYFSSAIDFLTVLLFFISSIIISSVLHDYTYL